MREPPKHLSYSALSQYLRCGEQYRLERIEKVAIPPAWYFMGGTAVHKATERMDRDDAYPYTEEQLALYWLTAFHEEVDEAFEGWPDDKQWIQVGRLTKANPDGQTYDYWLTRGLDHVRAWQDWRERTKDTLLISAVELKVDYVLPSGIKVTGIIDRVVMNKSQLLIPLDIKTATARPESPLQLAYYRQGLVELNGQVGVSEQGLWWMAKDGVAYPQKLRHLSLDVLDKYAVTYFRGVENEIFIPNITNDCYRCTVKDKCFAYER